MATDSFIQVPPDSTGKKLYARQHSIGGNPTQVPANHISCGADPSHLLIIDSKGQAYTRTAEGSQTIDGWGNTKMGENTAIGVYDYSINGMDDLFTDTLAVSGSLSYDQDLRGVTLSTTFSNGSSASRISNRYHYCQPGVGLLAMFPVNMGDLGKAGNIRTFGYGDASNGLFFQLNGTTLSVVVRKDNTGVVENIIINQEDWNGDKFDGTGVSGFNLNITNVNLYFIDISWLGSGTVRFGVITSDGSRWVCHTLETTNNSPFPFLSTGSLPVYFDNTNTAATGGASELRSYGASVYASSRTDYTFWRFSYGQLIPKLVTNSTPVVSLKPKLIVDTKINRVGLYPESLAIFVKGGSAAISLLDDAELTGATWNADGDTTADVDIEATALTGGETLRTWFLSPGCHNIDLSSIMELNDEGYHVLADGSDAYSMTIAGTNIDGDTVTVSCMINYRELR